MIIDLKIFILGKQLDDPSNESLHVKRIQELLSKDFEDKYIDYTNQSFEEIFDVKTMLLDELHKSMNHFSSTQWEPYSRPLRVETRSQLCPFNE